MLQRFPNLEAMIAEAEERHAMRCSDPDCREVQPVGDGRCIHCRAELRANEP